MAAALLLAAALAGCGSKSLTPPATQVEEKRPPAQLDPANWYPGDAHDHCIYSELAFYEEGLVSLAEVAEAAFEGDDPLAWLYMTDHGPQLGMKDGQGGSAATGRA